MGLLKRGSRWGEGAYVVTLTHPPTNPQADSTRERAAEVLLTQAFGAINSDKFVISAVAGESNTSYTNI